MTVGQWITFAVIALLVACVIIGALTAAVTFGYMCGCGLYEHLRHRRRAGVERRAAVRAARRMRRTELTSEDFEAWETDDEREL